MKLKIYDQSNEKTLLLSFGDFDGEPTLVVVDAEGNRRPSGYILSITPNGIRRHTCIHEDFGLPVDEKGRVKLVGED